MGKKFKVTSPNDMVDVSEGLVESLVEKFEKKFLKEDKDQEYYHLIISGEYNRKVYDEIERIYTEAGWKKVKCRSSSENKERPGMTGLQLWRNE